VKLGRRVEQDVYERDGSLGINVSRALEMPKGSIGCAESILEL